MPVCVTIIKHVVQLNPTKKRHYVILNRITCERKKCKRERVWERERKSERERENKKRKHMRTGRL